MFPWLRLIRVGFGLIAAPRAVIFTTTRVSLRVWPNDLDLNLRANNGRYHALADIGRLDWYMRTGLTAWGISTETNSPHSPYRLRQKAGDGVAIYVEPN